MQTMAGGARRKKRSMLASLLGLRRKPRAKKTARSAVLGGGLLGTIGKVLKDARIGSSLARQIPKIGHIAGPLIHSLGYGARRKRRVHRRPMRGRGLLADLAGLIPGVGGPLKLIGQHLGFGARRRGAGRLVPAGQYNRVSMPRSSRVSVPFSYAAGAGRRRMRGGMLGPDPSSVPVQNGMYVSYGGLRI
jgi:hypothetical protein